MVKGQDCDDIKLTRAKLEGTVNQKVWVFTSGFANRRNILLCNENIRLCESQGLRQSDYIRINIQPRIEPGIFNIQSPPGQDFVVDVKNIWNGVPCYSCSACGVMEILEVDTVANLIHGNIDARWKDGDRVQGSFSVPICP